MRLCVWLGGREVARGRIVVWDYRAVPGYRYYRSVGGRSLRSFAWRQIALSLSCARSVARRRASSACRASRRPVVSRSFAVALRKETTEEKEGGAAASQRTCVMLAPQRAGTAEAGAGDSENDCCHPSLSPNSPTSAPHPPPLPAARPAPHATTLPPTPPTSFTPARSFWNGRGARGKGAARACDDRARRADASLRQAGSEVGIGVARARAVGIYTRRRHGCIL